MRNLTVNLIIMLAIITAILFLTCIRINNLEDRVMALELKQLNEKKVSIDTSMFTSHFSEVRYKDIDIGWGIDYPAHAYYHISEPR